jgi:hypothetical protein
MSEMSTDTAGVSEADARGFTLMQRELDTGQLAWIWTAPGGAPQPRFLTRREAIAYMHDKLNALNE